MFPLTGQRRTINQTKREASQSTKVRIKVQSQIILVSRPTINQMVGKKHVKVQIKVQLQIIDRVTVRPQIPIFAGEKSLVPHQGKITHEVSGLGGQSNVLG